MKRTHSRLFRNKQEDYLALYCDNIVCEQSTLTLASGIMRGVICFHAIDSLEKGFEWGRMSLKYDERRDSMIRIYAYASDSKAYGVHDELDHYLSELQPGSMETNAALNGIYNHVGEGAECILDVSGRYLYVMLEFLSSGAMPILEGMSFSFRGDHMVDYLPSIYRTNGGFTKRFLSIFDSMSMDMERKIYDLPGRFDYEYARGEMLEYLANWMCVDEEDASKEVLLHRIRNAVEDYETMYTRHGIERTVQRLTGKKPLIIESAWVDPNLKTCINSKLYRDLYGDDPYRFFILLPEDAFGTREDMDRFVLLMQERIPVGTYFELVLLKRCVQLDRHTYLGVNTMVSDFVPVMIDESKTIHYDTMIGGNEVERV